jgi:hypothetical protein
VVKALRRTQRGAESRGGGGYSGREFRSVTRVLGAAVGVLGSAAGFLVTHILALLGRYREGQALARSLRAEVRRNNARVTDLLQRKGNGPMSPEWALLKMEAWQDTRARAAQLLPEQLTERLMDYYDDVHTVVTYDEALRLQGDPRDVAHLGDRGSTYPETQGHLAMGGTVVQRQLDEYLNRSPWKFWQWW